VSRTVEGAEPLVTACGRAIRVGELRFEAPGLRVARVTLAVGPERGGSSKVWAGLTPAEARALAWQLLDQAGRTEHAQQGGAR
jgi:hypothetical protein